MSSPEFNILDENLDEEIFSYREVRTIMDTMVRISIGHALHMEQEIRGPGINTPEEAVDWILDVAFPNIIIYWNNVLQDKDLPPITYMIPTETNKLWINLTEKLLQRKIVFPDITLLADLARAKKRIEKEEKHGS